MGILNGGYRGNSGYSGNFSNMQPTQQAQNMQIPNGNGMNFKAMLQNPQVKQQIRQVYQMFNGNPNALLNYVIQKNPSLRNNQALQMIMQSQNNPDGILGALGVSKQDFINIINGN